MFPAFGKVLSFLALTFGAVFVFFHFHGAVASGGKVLARQVTPVHAATAALNRSYDIGAASSGHVEADIKLPDISGYTVESIAAKVPPFQAGQVFIRPMAG